MIRRRPFLAATASSSPRLPSWSAQRASPRLTGSSSRASPLRELPASPRGDLARTHLEGVREPHGSRRFRAIPEQQKRPKWRWRWRRDIPAFDALNVGMHVQKRLIEKAKWMEDLAPFIAARA